MSRREANIRNRPLLYFLKIAAFTPGVEIALPAFRSRRILDEDHGRHVGSAHDGFTYCFDAVIDMATHHLTRRPEGGHVAVIVLFPVGVLSDRILERGRQHPTSENRNGDLPGHSQTYQAMELVEHVQESHGPFAIFGSHMRVQTRRGFVQCLEFVFREPYGWHCHDDAAQ